MAATAPWCGRSICVLTSAELVPATTHANTSPALVCHHAHFNSTIPAMGSMGSEPPPSSHGHSQNAQSHPFALNTSSNDSGSNSGISGNGSRA
ncbi:uncharacterized protein PHACADRAFT_253517 [Phanerochaete carnosa HHB-10118-sp]|uniref:Uncharacterized protein n=1 Tax=Phanerochaete carnosa (strain HHB-10118-sp) TaxID=650164 RepID=K5V1P4_PHACS|nr:uncharacterized protein PHACADRAFT_253517 [Phanerochaete carnosa HHB-10118-sp]EKM56421.1 hypothetical protein PHACADRAFT_253517 [Phanerochaete carnosa HHB-10118-sp]